MNYKHGLKNSVFVCQYCGIDFIGKNAYASYTPKYCSMNCFGLSKVKWQICEYCGVNFRTKPNGKRNKKYCSRQCNADVRRGKPLPEYHKKALSKAKKGKPIPHLHNAEVREKISEALAGKPQPWNRGKNHPNYLHGGLETTKRQKAMGRVEYKEWRRQVYDRDDYTCQMCGQRGGRLTADHIKPWASYPELRYALSNGRTLCVTCHRKTDTYGGRAVVRT